MVGLLLLLGLFWYWASTLIGDDNNGGDVTPTTAAVVITDETPTATATVAAGLTPTGETNQPANPTPTQPSGNNQPADETPTEESTETTGEPVSTAFALDDVVVTNDSANVRSSPTNAGGDDNVVDTLEPDTQLQIVGGPEEGNDLIWWQVEDPTSGEDVWIAESLIDAAP